MAIDPESYRLGRTDDAFHRQPSPDAFEWWYFDAHFDNGYSMVTSWHVGKPGGMDADLAYGHIMFSIYDPDGKKTDAMVALPADAVSASTETCDVKMGDNHVHGGFPRYEVHFRSNGIGGDLLFENLTQGYRNPPDGVTYFGREPDRYMGWAVAQPRARVSGRLVLDGKEMPVNGVGYHDHNWGNVSLRELCDHWYWGRLFLPDHTLIYSALQSSEGLGSERFSGVIAFKGEKLLEQVSDIYSEPGDLAVDEVTGLRYPRKWALKIKGARIKGEVIHRLRKIIESVEIPQAGKGHGYFRFLSDCEVKLDVDGEKVKDKTQVIHELMIP